MSEKVPGTYKSKASFESKESNPRVKKFPMKEPLNDTKVEDNGYDYRTEGYPGDIGPDLELRRAENLHVRHY